MGKDKHPHPGYEWIDDWKMVISNETDSEGYTYSADLVHKYHKDRNLLDALRRKKWVRKCRKIVEKEVPKNEPLPTVASTMSDGKDK